MKAAVFYSIYDKDEKGRSTVEHCHVHTFESPTAALQWVDKNNPRKVEEAPEGSTYARDLKKAANGLIEGRVDTVYYKGCDITTNLTESK